MTDDQDVKSLDPAMIGAVLENLGQGICVFDAELHLVMWNSRFAEMFGFPDGFLKYGTPFADLVRLNAERGDYGPCDVESLVARRVAQARRFEPHRLERSRPDGSIIEVIGNPLPGGGFVSTFTDVTVARQVAGNLRQSNDRLDQMVERRTRALRESEDRHRAYAEILEATVHHMPQGVCVFDSEQRLVVANQKMFDLLQMPTSLNVPGTPFEDFVLFTARRGDYGPGDPAAQTRERIEVARRMEPHVLERALPNGQVIEIRGNPIPGRGFISTFTDITARRQAEEALREAAAMARTMLDAPGLIVFLITLDGIIIDLNEGAAASLRRPKESLIGANVLKIMPPEASARRAAYAQLAVAEGRAIHFEDEVHNRWYEVAVTPYPVDQGEVPRLLIITHEVTHRHRAEQRLREAKVMAESANRSKTDFLAAMSHELRTPLNAIIGFSEIIAREMFGPVGERYRSYGNDINGAGQHLLAMINDILDISRIEIGAFTLSEEAISPRELARSCLRLITSRAEQGSIHLIDAVSPNLPRLRVDVRRTKQILINLLGNAVKFTPSGGSVTLSACRDPDGSFIFGVSDTGIGMSEDEIAIALAPFGQVDSGLDRRFEGVGLGLPLAKSLMELHGGSLMIRSRPNEGTSVTVRFPPETILPPETIPTGCASAN